MPAWVPSPAPTQPHAGAARPSAAMLVGLQQPRPAQASPSSNLPAWSRLVVRTSLDSDGTHQEEAQEEASDSTPASRAEKAQRLLPNAKILKLDGQMKMQHSLGVDFGDARTGIAISFRGFAPAPLSVCKLRGDKLVGHLLEVASKQRADEFIVGLPQSWDGKETDRSNKTRSFAGRLAQHAAERSDTYVMDMTVMMMLKYVWSNVMVILLSSFTCMKEQGLASLPARRTWDIPRCTGLHDSFVTVVLISVLGRIFSMPMLPCSFYATILIVVGSRHSWCCPRKVMCKTASSHCRPHSDRTATAIIGKTSNKEPSVVSQLEGRASKDFIKHSKHY